MSIPASRLLEIARADAPAIWVRVETVRGSAPREPGASMLVHARLEEGTIGGGHLELEAIAQARRMLVSGERVAGADFVLGAALGQCCGGAVELSLRRIDARETAWIEALRPLDREAGTVWLDTRPGAEGAPHTVASPGRPADAPRDAGGAVPHRISRVDGAPWNVWVFGAGHVGEAVVRVLATLPLCATWVDPRENRFPAGLPANVSVLESDSPAHEVAAIPSGADVLVMTHSHGLDFELCLVLLAREDLGLVGLIGSETKAASFRARLARRGVGTEALARLQCPIGAVPRGTGGRHRLDRHPGAIAVAVGFDLWERRRAAAPASGPAAEAVPVAGAGR
ncbi:MAG: xanthine dehydrogenase accessory protein XdhC [Burkholderiales bacterium]|nr:xanthine dehydrogenase accessory protein XdhC [Burkholderiales bacterium]